MNYLMRVCMCKVVDWVHGRMWSREGEGMLVGNRMGVGYWVRMGNRVGNVVGSCIKVGSHWMRMKKVVGTLVVLVSPEHLWRGTNVTSRFARRSRTSSFFSIDGFWWQGSSVAHAVAVPVFSDLPFLLETKFNELPPIFSVLSHIWKQGSFSSHLLLIIPLTNGRQKPYSEQQGAKEGQPYSHWTA